METLSHNPPEPMLCDECAGPMRRATLPEYSMTMKHDGRSYTVRVENLEVDRCTRCDEIRIDAAAIARLYDALRQQLGLLSPADMKAKRHAIGKRQSEMASELGIAAETISRWESGSILPSRLYNEKLVEYFRTHLPGPSTLPALYSVGSVVQIHVSGTVTVESAGAFTNQALATRLVNLADVPAIASTTTGQVAAAADRPYALAA